MGDVEDKDVSCEILVDEIKQLLVQILKLESGGEMSSSRFVSLFPPAVLNVVRAIDSPLGMFKDDVEYFSFLRCAQLLWMEINLSKL